MKKHSFGIRNFGSYSENPYKQAYLESGDNKDQVITINKRHLIKLLSLSRTSLKLLGYLMYMHEEGSEIVYFNLRACRSQTGFKDKRSIYNALTELLGEQIIARTKNENIYYLNAGIIITSERA